MRVRAHAMILRIKRPFSTGRAMLGSARTREAQNWRLLQAAAVGVMAGLILFPLLGFPLARSLPFGSLPDALATAVLGEDGWSGAVPIPRSGTPSMKPCSGRRQPAMS
jgi:hypothetical protein